MHKILAEYGVRLLQMTARGIASAEHILVVGGGLVAVELGNPHHPVVGIIYVFAALLGHCLLNAIELGLKYPYDLFT